MTNLELLEIWALPEEWKHIEPGSMYHPKWDSLSTNQRTKAISLIYEIEGILGLNAKETDERSHRGAAQRTKILEAARKMFK